MPSDNRRRFLQAAAAAIASPAAPILGAGDTVNIAIIGLGGRGRDHLREYLELPHCRVAALCDVNQAALERATATVQRAKGYQPTGYSDLRKLYDDKQVDAVSIVTPNHWHALATIWACQAGKDVYVEKPASHNVFEGRQMVAAARKYNRMVQVGSQSRSLQHKRRAIELLHQGVIGQLYYARGLCYRRRKSIGRTPIESVPAGLNWDLFLGPAPMRPYTKNRFAYNWHWFWDTGNGDIGNQGVHEMDICRWGMQPAAFPRAVVSTGNKFLYDDDQETPNMELATLDYGASQITFEVRGLFTGAEDGIPMQGGNLVGNLFFGSEGYMALHPWGFQVYKSEARELVMEEKYVEKKVWDTAPHMANFLDAVRRRDHKVLNADIAEGAASAALGHLANIAYRRRARLALDPATGRFLNDPEANALLTRPYRPPYIVK